MLFTDQTKEDLSSKAKEASRSYVAYNLGFYFPSEEMPQRKSGTGTPKWDDLTPLQKQLATSVDTAISNAIYAHQQELLAAQKLDTIIKLSRALNDESLVLALKALDITTSSIAS